ncbi:Glutathione-regulated potassium-efflux system protein KefB [Methylophaga frappieri]|uniref:Glutathione-regulated potassium-efflux system protein KefB n=1 Tax=Methylophaga frappieri (strain ATCC BAA-2434 / DSM 25690 / JAM7) TaxID=754477 RepID=I1YJA4_METFJ|nr:monovalent cation:proton antiporter-2 (CPA2) family protein [Methylophaga frappieri]AFJ02997.1 Glutathione-regulated potassium-efflux system protein KefB [Methylophaga frappieri]
MDTSGADYLIDVLMLLLATVVILPIFHKIRLGAILGYLAAGMILGPWGLSVITEVEDVRHLAEFGVIFLLFVLGIELRPDKLWEMRKLVFGLGLAQLLITAASLYAIAYFGFGLSHKTAVIIGFGLALSSTAFCLQLLSERGGISTLMGRMSISVLLLQDIAVVPLLALVSYYAGGGAEMTEPGWHLLYPVLFIIGLLLAGHYLLNPLLSRIVASGDPEVFMAVALLLVLGAAWLMHWAGLSMAMGAFLAGIMLAESHYRHQIEADILPFRGILLGLFFMTVGMDINFDLLWDKLGLVVGLTIALMLLKASIVYVLARLVGAKHAVSLQTATLLSQSGEFGFVLFGVAASSGVLATDISHMLTLVIALTMLLTPFAVRGVNKLILMLSSHQQVNGEKYEQPEFIDDAQQHVILAGFGRVGARIAALMHAAGVNYIGLDMRESRVKDARAQGFPVYFGDASKMKVLRAAGADRASMIVVALDNPQQVDRLVAQVRNFYPNMPIHTRARDRKHCADLVINGATTVVSETLETSLRLTEQVLIGNGVSEAEVRSVLNAFREDYYSNVVKKVAEDQVVLGELKH